MIKISNVLFIFVIVLLRSPVAEGYPVPLYLLFDMALNLYYSGGQSGEGRVVLSDDVIFYGGSHPYVFHPKPQLARIPAFELMDESGTEEPLQSPVFYRTERHTHHKQPIRAELVPRKPYGDLNSETLWLNNKPAALLVKIRKNELDLPAVIIFSKGLVSLNPLKESSGLHDRSDLMITAPSVEALHTRYDVESYHLADDRLVDSNDTEFDTVQRFISQLNEITGNEAFAYKNNGEWFLVYSVGKTIKVISLYDLQQKVFGELENIPVGRVPMYMAGRSPLKKEDQKKVPAVTKGKSFKKQKKQGKAIKQEIKQTEARPQSTPGSSKTKTGESMLCRFCDYVQEGRAQIRGLRLLEHIMVVHGKKAVFCPVFKCKEVVTSPEELQAHAKSLKLSADPHKQCSSPYCHFYTTSVQASNIMKQHCQRCSVDSVLEVLKPAFQSALSLYMGHRWLLNNRTKRVCGEGTKYECRVCNMPFKERLGLATHLGAVHQAPCVLCPVPGCAFFFDTEAECRAHIATIKALSRKLQLHCDDNEHCHFAAFNAKVYGEHQCKQDGTLIRNKLHCQVYGCDFKADNKRDLLAHCQEKKDEDAPFYALECHRQYCHASFGTRNVSSENLIYQGQHVISYHGREFHQRRKVSHYLPPCLWDMSGLNQALSFLDDEQLPEHDIVCVDGLIAWHIEWVVPPAFTESQNNHATFEIELDPVTDYLGPSSEGYAIQAEVVCSNLPLWDEDDDPSGDTPLMVASSDIHGKGVHASRNIAKHRFIARFTGKTTTSRTYWDLNHCLFIQDLSGRWVMIKPDPNNLLKFLNHSDDPNAIFHNERPGELYALKYISDDEEITVNYHGDTPEGLDWSVLQPIDLPLPETKVLRYDQKVSDEKPLTPQPLTPQ